MSALQCFADGYGGDGPAVHNLTKEAIFGHGFPRKVFGTGKKWRKVANQTQQVVQIQFLLRNSNEKSYRRLFWQFLLRELPPAGIAVDASRGRSRGILRPFPTASLAVPELCEREIFGERFNIVLSF